jgi:periplasmic protein TonB
MPRDLFGDVTDPSITLGTRKWYTVPVSLGVHSVIVALLIIAPLMATGALPLLHDPTVYMPPEPPELPQPPEVVRPKALAEPVANPAAAPVEEPKAIAEEPPFDPGVENQTPAESIVGAGTLEGTDVVAPPPIVAEPPAPTPTVNVGGNIRQPERMTYVSPTYPLLALTARVQGLVIIQATIDTTGRVQDARVMRTDSPLLNGAALTAVRQWVYTPTLLNGIPVNVIMTVTVQFRMN